MFYNLRQNDNERKNKQQYTWRRLSKNSLSYLFLFQTTEKLHLKRLNIR